MNADELRIQLIPVKQITVLNPRDRSKRKFGQIINNIAKLGLKKPVTVAHLEGRNGEAKYLLVCGQGRLEAYIALGEARLLFAVTAIRQLFADENFVTLLRAEGLDIAPFNVLSPASAKEAVR